MPEIALTPAMAGQFYHRFGEGVAILHFRFHDAERAEQWRRIRKGLARWWWELGQVSSLRCRTWDSSSSTKSTMAATSSRTTPRYNGRDVAVVRAHTANACVVLGSATPSLETRYNVERGKYTLLDLPERIEKRPMPEVELIDMRQEFLETRKQATFSRRLFDSHSRERTG